MHLRGTGWGWGGRKGMGASNSCLDLNYWLGGEAERFSTANGQNPSEAGDGAQWSHTELSSYDTLLAKLTFLLVCCNRRAQTQIVLGRSTSLFPGCRDRFPGRKVSLTSPNNTVWASGFLQSVSWTFWLMLLCPLPSPKTHGTSTAVGVAGSNSSVPNQLEGLPQATVPLRGPVCTQGVRSPAFQRVLRRPEQG